MILLHQMATNRITMLELAEVFTHSGYGVLLMDIRAHGESDGEVLQFGGDEAEDVVAAATYLQTRGDVDPERIGVLGWSLGAQVAILGAARTDLVKAVVADAPCCTVFSDWPSPQTLNDWLWKPYDLAFHSFLRLHTGVRDPVPVGEAVGQIAPRPILLIGTGNTAGLEARSIQEKYDQAGEPKEMWIIPEAGHIQGFKVRPEEYGEKVTAFFDASLPDEVENR